MLIIIKIFLYVQYHEPSLDHTQDLSIADTSPILDSKPPLYDLPLLVESLGKINLKIFNKTYTT